MDNQYPLVTSNQQILVSNQFFNLSEILNSTGLYYYLKNDPRYESLKTGVADVLVSYFERNQNQAFHNNLNFLERVGFLSNTKMLAHQKRMGIQKGLLGVGVGGVLNNLPAAIDYMSHAIKVKQIKEFVIGWLAYVNKENPEIVRRAVERFYYKVLKTDFNLKEYSRIFEACLSTDKKPLVRDSFKDKANNLFSFILQASDINNDDVRNRALEFGDYLDIQANNMDETLEMSKANMEVLADMCRFTAFTLHDFYSDFVESAEHAKQYAFYCIENDPNAVNRTQNKKKILAVGPVLAMAALTTITGPVGDAVLVAATPVIHILVNKELDLSKGVEIGKRLRGLHGSERHKPNN